MKYKKEEVAKISWKEFENYANKIHKEVASYLNKNKIKIELIIPILRGGDILAGYLSHKFNCIRFLPIQYKYFKDNVIKKMLNLNKDNLRDFDKENPTILLVEGNHSSGNIANKSLIDIKEMFPKSKIIYVALAKDYFYKNSVKGAAFTTCGFYTNENRKLTKEECKKLKIAEKKVYIFPWENYKEELAALNNIEY